MRPLTTALIILATTLSTSADIHNTHNRIPQTPMDDSNDKKAYKAPLENCDLPNAVPDDYVVYLKPGYSLQQHEQTIGSAILDGSVKYVYDDILPNQICYNAKFGTDAIAAVRADPGVEMVECNLQRQAMGLA